MNRKLISKVAKSYREKMLKLAFSDEASKNQALLLNETAGLFSPAEVDQIEEYWKKNSKGGEIFFPFGQNVPWWMHLLGDAANSSATLTAFPEGKQMLKELTVSLKVLEKKIKQLYKKHDFDVEVTVQSEYNFLPSILRVSPSDDLSNYTAIFSILDEEESYVAIWEAGFGDAKDMYDLYDYKGPDLDDGFKSTVIAQLRFLDKGLDKIDNWLSANPDAWMALFKRF